MRDLVLGTVTLVSTNVAGTFANGDVGTPVISPDGRYVAFDSSASDLVAGDTNGYTDVFVRDLTTATTALVSVGATGGQGNQASWGASITGDASRIAFVSVASNLVANDLNGGNSDVFVRDRNAGTTRLVSVSTGAACCNGSTNIFGASVLLRPGHHPGDHRRRPLRGLRRRLGWGSLRHRRLHRHQPPS